MRVAHNGQIVSVGNLVYFHNMMCESPIVLHGFVQSGIWYDHFKTTIMNLNCEQNIPKYFQ